MSILGKDIETVDSYKYLDHWHRRLVQEGPESPPLVEETEVLLGVQDSAKNLLRLCRSICAVVCWGGGRTHRARRKIDKLVRRSSSVLGCSLDSVETLGERRMLAKLTSIMDMPRHPLHEAVGALSSSFSQTETPSLQEGASSQQQLDSRTHRSHSGSLSMGVCMYVYVCVCAPVSMRIYTYIYMLNANFVCKNCIHYSTYINIRFLYFYCFVFWLHCCPACRANT